MSLQQISILSLFNHYEAQTFESLSSQTSMTFAELERHLKPLIDLNILVRTGQGNDCLISINANFTR